MKPHKAFWILLTALTALPATAADITVSAAASLSNAFKDIAQSYQQQYPDDKVRLNTAGSGTLLQQAVQGAPVDVLAFADQETMDKAAAKDLIHLQTRRNFARNTLVAATPAASKLTLVQLTDLTKPQFERIAVSNPNSVPAGSYAQAALQKAGVWQALQPKIIRTQHVRQTLDYIARGEVDVGFVYRTDAALMKNKVRILRTVPTDKPVSYPIAVTRSGRQQAEAQRFVNYVLSPAGRAILARYGFKQP